MTRLADIPVRIELDLPRNGLGGGIMALLSELADCLDRLSTRDECATIDLRSLPLSPEDRRDLRNILGEGEVKATLNAEGESTLRETKFSGIWWIEHHSSEGDLVGDLLEVTRCPAIIASASDEILAAAENLIHRIQQLHSVDIRMSRQ